MEQSPQPPVNKLAELQAWEGTCKKALEEASKPAEEGGATPSVIEELRHQYFVAKQAREDFEKQ